MSVSRNMRVPSFLSIVLAAGVLFVAGVRAVDTPGGFSLQVSPSPLITTVAPGQTQELELKIRNAGTAPEQLKIESRKFSVNRSTGQVLLDDTKESEIAPWVRFSAPTFTVLPGQWYTQKIRITVPKDSGFSYSMALVISRAKNEKIVDAGRLIKGSVAVFTLINVDRPGAVRKIEVTDFKPTQTVYEYLPARFTTTFSNSGNTIVQPFGNIFIQRSSTDTQPIATLPVNDKGGYLLPGVPRTMTSEWTNGFPLFVSKTDANGDTHEDLTWDWSQIANFRIGPYTAKLVAIYNDGQRDVPIERTVTFWVVPWRTMLIIGLIVGMLLYLRHKQIQRRTNKAIKKALEEHQKREKQANDNK